MEFYKSSFFQTGGPPPKLVIDRLLPYDAWTNTIKIEMVTEHNYANNITFYLRSESDLISFINSVKQAYDKYRKGQGYDN